MKLYLADTNNQNHESASHALNSQGHVHRLLVSYWYYKTIDMDKLVARFGNNIEVFADSGAFSAWSLGGVIQLKEYAEWLLKYKHLFTVYANLDEKRYSMNKNIQIGIKNLQYLESLGLEPLPVYHGGEPISILDGFIKDYPYIALGGVSGHTRSGSPQMWRFILQCFERAENKSVFHGFGITDWKFLTAFKWYSVDSSSWGQGFRFGSVPVFDPLSF